MRGVRKYVLLGVLFPGLAWGADVRLSIAGSAEYDSNILRSQDNPKGDAVFRVTPSIRLVEDREKFDYSVGYSLPYEVGVTHTTVNDLNQLADANFSYRASPQTQIFGNDGFFYVRGLFSQQQNLGDPTNGQVGDKRDQILQNNISLGAKHLFTPRLSGTLMVNNGYYDTNQFNRANVLSFGGSASSEYQLTPHHQLGGGFSFSRQMFNDTFNRPASDTDYYNLFGSWEWMFDETTTLDIQAGPALIHSAQDSPPMTSNQRLIPFVQNGDGSVTVFDYVPSACPTMSGTTLLFNNAGNTCPQIRIPTSNPAGITYVTSTGDQPNGPRRIPARIRAVERHWHQRHLLREREPDQALEPDARLEPRLRSPGKRRLGHRRRRRARRRHPEQLLAGLGALGSLHAYGLDATPVGDERGAGVREPRQHQCRARGPERRHHRESGAAQFLRLPRYAALGGGGEARLPAHEEHRDGASVRL